MVVSLLAGGCFRRRAPTEQHIVEVRGNGVSILSQKMALRDPSARSLRTVSKIEQIYVAIGSLTRLGSGCLVFERQTPTRFTAFCDRCAGVWADEISSSR